MKMRVCALSCLLTLSAACTAPKVITRTEVVTRDVIVYRDIPAHLTAPCEATYEPTGAVTYADVFVLWAKDRAALEACNGQLAGIESLNTEDQ